MKRLGSFASVFFLGTLRLYSWLTYSHFTVLKNCTEGLFFSISLFSGNLSQMKFVVVGNIHLIQFLSANGCYTYLEVFKFVTVCTCIFKKS